MVFVYKHAVKVGGCALYNYFKYVMLADASIYLKPIYYASNMDSGIRQNDVSLFRVFRGFRGKNSFIPYPR